MRITVFRESDGTIMRTVTVPGGSEAADLNCERGESWLRGTWDDERHYPCVIKSGRRICPDSDHFLVSMGDVRAYVARFEIHCFAPSDIHLG